MKDFLLRQCDPLIRFWTEFRYESGFGPAPWAHLDRIKAIESDGKLRVDVFRCSCCTGYLIDLQAEDAWPPTIALLRSEDLDLILELLRDAREAISLAEHCDD